MECDKKQQHGGKRKGCGHPPLGGNGAGESRSIVVRLPAQLHDKLDALAKESWRSKSEVVRIAIERGIDEIKNQKNQEL